MGAVNAAAEKGTDAASTVASQERPAAQQPRISIPRRWTRPTTHPFDEIEWELRSATIGNEKGEIVFEQKEVEVPAFWTQLATNVVISKYFRGALGTPSRERSVKQLVGRVANTITDWGIKDGYFATAEDAETFRAELTYMLVNQYGAFNSPVWFNVGIEKKPQCSACFILSVDDTMESILEWYRNEGMIFKYGSGSGLNVSNIRSARERLAGGGTASGPVSFMKAADASAGVIKSGGKTRRAAKMVVLNAEHPDVNQFIMCKWKEEEKAHKLIDVGYDAAIDGEAYGSVFFQNANNSVRVTDDFMKRALADEGWDLKSVTTGEVIERVQARDILRLIAEATWHCGDPGMQFDTTINDWHTCSNTGRINASNPCSEYMHLDNSACNLASINLLKFMDDEGNFLTEPFKHAVRIFIIAQDIVVQNSSYPTEKIHKNANDYRELGLGFANLGAVLMSLGIAYDSDEGRAWAGAVSAVMCGHAYEVSGEIAERMGPYAGFERNREPQIRVLRKHRAQVDKINHRLVPQPLLQAAAKVWDAAIEHGESAHGVRNSQMTVIAPTGTIAFMMDCDTTGIEPDIALVKYKRLVGGGMLKIVNQTVPKALQKLGYTEDEISAILKHINERDTIEGAPGLKPEHLPIFDCAFKAMNGTRYIHYMGHVRMMGAVQPFISGAISKTVNLPQEASIDDVTQAYVEAWRLGIKALAIYRDGSKKVQPLSTSKEDKNATKAKAGTPYRRRLPDERQAITHKFSVGGHEGYLTVGLFEDGQPGEIFITMSKEGSTLSGLMDSFATMVSLSLQYGVPTRVLVNKFNHVRFEPSGITNNKDIRFAKSVIDYIFRWMALKFMPAEEAQQFKVTETPGSKPANGNGASAAAGAAPAAAAAAPKTSAGSAFEQHEKTTFVAQADAPACPDCGSLMVRNAACYKCLNCGCTSGCS